MPKLQKRCQSLKSETLSLRTAINELDFLKKAVIIPWNSWQKIYFLLLANKLIEKVPDPRKAKEHYQSFIRKKNRKSVKQSEMITYQPKALENPNIVNIQ